MEDDGDSSGGGGSRWCKYGGNVLREEMGGRELVQYSERTRGKWGECDLKRVK